MSASKKLIFTTPWNILSVIAMVITSVILNGYVGVTVGILIAEKWVNNHPGAELGGLIPFIVYPLYILIPLLIISLIFIIQIFRKENLQFFFYWLILLATTLIFSQLFYISQ